MSNKIPFIDVLAKGQAKGRRTGDMERFERSYKAEITSIYALTNDISLYQIQLAVPQERERFTFQPGQFVMLEVPGIGEAPFSISSSPVRHGSLELCIRRAGNLTNFLSRLSRGAVVGIRGPFGTSFPLERMEGYNVLFVAGGLGIAPLRSPLSHVLENRSRYSDVNVIYGVRRPEDLLFTYQYDMWRKFDVKLSIISQEPSPEWEGPTGMITDALLELCGEPECRFKDTYAIVCGPPVMFKFVCNMLSDAGIRMQNMFVSLERRMHCGMGKCCRCNVGSTYTCIEGPVFDYWSVMNLKEAI